MIELDSVAAAHPTNTTVITKIRRFLMAEMLKVKAALASRHGIDAEGGVGRWCSWWLVIWLAYFRTLTANSHALDHLCNKGNVWL